MRGRGDLQHVINTEEVKYGGGEIYNMLSTLRR